MQLSTTHLVLIPSYNSGPLLLRTVRQARAVWAPVWVVVDGSTDGSDMALASMEATDPELRVLRLERNGGKGAAVLHALRLADRMGFTHALVMDADAQHPADHIVPFMAASQAEPAAMVLGRPVFGPDAPRVRVYWRRMSNFWANIETLWAGVGDSLFGFRVYPVPPLVEIMAVSRWMRRFDFDPEAVVRLCWHGVTPLTLPAPVRYLAPAEGGVSHFRYGRDNLLLGFMHLRLILGFLPRLPCLMRRRLRGRLRVAKIRAQHCPGNDAHDMRPSRRYKRLAPRQNCDDAGMTRQFVADSMMLYSPLATPVSCDMNKSVAKFDEQTEAEQALAKLIVASLQLESDPADIAPEEPLFGDGLGLDSIDALELALAISKTYGIELRSDDQQNHRIFASLRTLSAHIEASRGGVTRS